MTSSTHREWETAQQTLKEGKRGRRSSVALVVGEDPGLGPEGDEAEAVNTLASRMGKTKRGLYPPDEGEEPAAVDGVVGEEGRQPAHTPVPGPAAHEDVLVGGEGEVQHERVHRRHHQARAQLRQPPTTDCVGDTGGEGGGTGGRGGRRGGWAGRRGRP